VSSRIARALELLGELELDERERLELAGALGRSGRGAASAEPELHAEVIAERAEMTGSRRAASRRRATIPWPP